MSDWDWASPVLPRLPVPGKILPIMRDRRLRAVAAVSVEEHTRHVLLALDVAARTAEEPISACLRQAATYHDFRKKLGIQPDLRRRLSGWGKCQWEEAARDLRGDFHRTLGPRHLSRPASGPRVPLPEMLDAYCAFARSETGHLFGPDQVFDGPPKLPRPFGNHADEFRAAEDFPDGADGLEQEAEMVRLHHSFQVATLVTACARWGEGFARDLYRLMAADHLGSRWAEEMILRAERDDRAPVTESVSATGVPGAACRASGALDGRPRWADFGEWRTEFVGAVSRDETADGSVAGASITLLHAGHEPTEVPFQVLYAVREVSGDA